METGPGALDADAVETVLRRLGLAAAHERVRCVPLAGGVSSDIVRADLPGRSVCVKRALGRLKVAADWRVPVGRSAFEAAWLDEARRVAPGAAPALLGFDEPGGTIVMTWLDPESHPVWKARLRDGPCDAGFAARVGATLARIHASTAGDPRIGARFDSGALFHALRLEPYLLATAARHPALAPRLHALARSTAATRVALVHGDVSPKNLLVGPHGPVLLDAECAWYGDPAFDAAFCLNHLLLKCLWNRRDAGSMLAGFDAFADAYLAAVDWEPAQATAARIAALLPALMLARVDGKSPVEYLLDEADRDLVRGFAGPRIAAPPDGPHEVASAWRDALPVSGRADPQPPTADPARSP